MSNIEPQVSLDYTNRDFQAIRSQLVGLAKGFFPEWETAGETTDMGTLILELFAYMGDVMNFYIDRVGAEAFLGTAQRRQSVLYIADMLGYRPFGQRAANVALDITMSADALDDTLTLPAGTRIHDSQNASTDVIVFELDTDVVLTKGNTSQGFATEGITVYDSLIAVSWGAPTMEVLITDVGVVDGSLRVVSREGGQVVDWTEISDISLGRPTQSVFTTYLDDQGRTNLVFGDNAAGRVPPNNAEIFATYRVGSGAKANLLASNTLEVIVPPSDFGDKILDISVTNPSPPVGGSDPESVDSMRYSIPRASGRIKSRAITLADYADLALQVPGVAKSTAYGTIYTSIHVRIAPVGGTQTVPVGSASVSMDKLTKEVASYMSNKILVGSNVVVEPTNLDAAPPVGIWEDVFIRLDIQVQDAYNRTTVRQEVEAVLRNLLSFDNMDFGKRVDIGLVYRTSLSVQGVDYVTLKHLSTTAPSDETDLDSAPDIVDVVPDPILIPRIDPTDVTETIVDFDQEWLEEEEERTHDGLWIKAQGGLTNS